MSKKLSFVDYLKLYFKFIFKFNSKKLINIILIKLYYNLF